MTIWMVEGSTGEYSDHREWPICAYTNKTDAEAHVAAASAAARDIQEKIRNLIDSERGWDWESEEKLRKSNEFDLDMQFDSSGIYYTTYKVELKDRFKGGVE